MIQRTGTGVTAPQGDPTREESPPGRNDSDGVVSSRQKGAAQYMRPARNKREPAMICKMKFTRPKCQRSSSSNAVFVSWHQGLARKSSEYPQNAKMNARVEPASKAVPTQRKSQSGKVGINPNFTLLFKTVWALRPLALTFFRAASIDFLMGIATNAQVNPVMKISEASTYDQRLVGHMACAERFDAVHP